MTIMGRMKLLYKLYRKSYLFYEGFVFGTSFLFFVVDDLLSVPD